MPALAKRFSHAFSILVFSVRIPKVSGNKLITNERGGVTSNQEYFEICTAEFENIVEHAKYSCDFDTDGHMQSEEENVSHINPFLKGC